MENAKLQLTNEQQKHAQFRTVITDLKDIVFTVQKEIGVPQPSKQAAGTARNIKTELETIKKLILDKIRADREEVVNKEKSIQKEMSEIQTLQKQIEESENKLKEKDIKIGQMTNFVNSTKTRISNQQNTINELTKELNETKEKLQQQQQQTATSSSCKLRIL